MDMELIDMSNLLEIGRIFCAGAFWFFVLWVIGVEVEERVLT